MLRNAYILVAILGLTLGSLALLLPSGCSGDPSGPGFPAPEPVVLEVTTGASGVLLYWTPAGDSNFQCYEVWWASTPETPTELEGSIYEANDPQMYVFSAAPGELRYYWVKVVGVDGISWSNRVTIRWQPPEGGWGPEGSNR
jgi:hypothetical protein